MTCHFLLVFPKDHTIVMLARLYLVIECKASFGKYLFGIICFNNMKYVYVKSETALPGGRAVWGSTC